MRFFRVCCKLRKSSLYRNGKSGKFEILLGTVPAFRCTHCSMFIPPSIILPWFPPTGRFFLMCTRSVSFIFVGDRGIVRQLHAAPLPSPFFLQNQSFLLPHPLLCILLLLRPPPVAQLSFLHKRRKKGCSLLDLVIAPRPARPMRKDPPRLLPLTTKVFATVAQQHHTDTGRGRVVDWISA